MIDGIKKVQLMEKLVVFPIYETSPPRWQLQSLLHYTSKGLSQNQAVNASENTNYLKSIVIHGAVLQIKL